MEIQEVNNNLFSGNINSPEMFPALARLQAAPYIFNNNFGLDTLPSEPGILVIRGARQYGKSTWLEQQLKNTIIEFGAGTAFYLNGDDIADRDSLHEKISELLPLYHKDAKVCRLFIDEITAIERWETVLKRLADKGLLSKILVITTGSKATDLRRGLEKLPGRKGKLKRSHYLFLPISFNEFYKKCHKKLGDNILIAYLLSSGSPIACSELASTGRLPEYLIELVRDWIEGEIAATSRTRSALINIMSTLFRFACTPIGQAKLARESGLANNTVAANYIEILNDLGCVTPSYPWDFQRKILILRKPCKYHFTNLLSAVAYHPAKLRTCEDFLKLSPMQQAPFYEWLIAQEIQRKASLENYSILEPLAFWETKKNEIDFVDPNEQFIEVKRGKSSPLEFSWFDKQLPHVKLTVINQQSFSTNNITGLTIEDFLKNYTKCM